jgi:hypothetical protein
MRRSYRQMGMRFPVIWKEMSWPASVFCCNGSRPPKGKSKHEASGIRNSGMSCSGSGLPGLINARAVPFGFKEPFVLLSLRMFCVTYRAEWRAGKSLDSYSGDVRFECDQDADYLDIFRGFLQFSQTNSVVLLLLGHGHLPPNPF